jgi:hypothetical protein
MSKKKKNPYKQVFNPAKIKTPSSLRMNRDSLQLPMSYDQTNNYEKLSLLQSNKKNRNIFQFVRDTWCIKY